jgi:hypothetical protein
VVTGGSTAIGDLTTNMQELTAQVVPNPSETYFTLHVQSSSRETIVVKVYDIAGRQVDLLRGPAGNSFQFGHKLTAGIYIVQVIQGNNVKVLRVMKI